MRLHYTLGYVGLIILVNIGFSYIPQVELPNGDRWPLISLVVGLIFVVRDFAQREIGHRIVLAMLGAGAISYILADPFVAIASVVAFFVSEFSDWAIYSFTGRSFSERVLLSSAVSTPLDTIIFLGMINQLSTLGACFMILSKMMGALVVWWIVKNRE